MQRRVKAGEQRHGEMERDKRERKDFYWSVLLLVYVFVGYRQTHKKKKT